MFIKKCIPLLIALALICASSFTVHASETSTQTVTQAATKAEETTTTQHSTEATTKAEESKAQPSTETVTKTEELSKPEEPVTADTLPSALTGTGTVISSERAEDGKVFYTIEATDGSIFYLIIDNDSVSDNVYFLTPVTIDNLASFAASANDDTSILGPLFSSGDKEPDKSKDNSSTESSQENTPKTEGSFLSRNWQIIAIFAVMIVAFPIIYYIKIIKPKKAKKAAENQEYDIYEEEICENGYEESEPDSDEEMEGEKENE